MSAPRVLIAAGGTAGHVVPALAVADALRAEGAGVEFVGGERAEADLVPQAGYELHQLRVSGLHRRNPARALRALGQAAVATREARRLIRSLQVDAVLGGGGYVSGPLGLAAASGRLPLFLMEADSHIGIANRALARFARRVYLAFPVAGRGEPRFMVTGRPVPASTAGTDRDAARERFRIPAASTCLLVFGGSLGARSLNDAAIDAFGEMAPFVVLHACGKRDYAALRARLDALGWPSHYHLVAYVEPFADALAAADLAAARAGGSVFELAAAGLPAVLIPYPRATADHQAANARWMADAGAAVVVSDDELDAERLRAEVERIAGDRGRLAEMRAAALRLARPDAAERIARDLLSLLLQT